jgi:hypothetical protein
MTARVVFQACQTWFAKDHFQHARPKSIAKTLPDTRRLVRPRIVRDGFRGVAKSARRANHFDFAESCQAPKSKIFCFTEDPNQAHNPSRPEPIRGTLRGRHETLGLGCDGRCGVRCLHRTKAPQRTAKSCGPGAATLASIRPACAGTATVTIKAAHRGEHEGTRKAIARGKPGCLGCTCSSTPVLFAARGLRAQSAPGFPCALCLRGTTRLHNPGEKPCRGNESPCFFARH